MPRITLTRFGPTLVALGLVLAPSAALAQAASPSPGVHVVQDGETLLQIALNAGVDVDALAALNGLDDPNALAIGEPLKLPTPTPAAPVAGGTYTVADGDNLWDIAQKLGTSSDVLQQLNGLDDPSKLSLGMVLKVPAGAAAHAAPAPAVPATAASATGTAAPTSGPPPKNILLSYTVPPGETLNHIARQFSVPPDAIVQASNLSDPNKVGAGAVLKIPVPAKQHTVTDGETLRDIAAAEKVDLGTLIDFNQIDDPSLIRVGQVVVVPVAATQQAASASDSASSLASPAATPTPTAKPAPVSAPSAPSAPPSPKPSPAATPKPATAATPKPVAPLVVVSPPPGAPTDGIAGAGLKLLGSPYVWGGSSPSGFDCSGFVWYLARQLGKPLSRGMFGQYNSGSHPSRQSLQPGDIVFFQNTFAAGLSHNGIYIGNGQFVHAADESAGVTISSLNTPYWSSHWFGATRLP